MSWVVGGVLIGAAVVAVLVLGFCAYELTWKANRLRRDLARLMGLSDDVAALRVELAAAQLRLADPAS